MKPYEPTNLPIIYDIDKELLMIITEANSKYSEYKTLINTLLFDASLFLESVILNESYKSTQIEGTEVSHDEVYYMKYTEDTDEKKEIQNLKRCVEYGYESLSKDVVIDIELVNTLNKIILDSVRGDKKSPGSIRTTQNWIGPKGCTIDEATFVPPRPEDIYDLLDNLYKYMNDAYEDPILVNAALSHAQFETIHAYNDGSGRLGRVLIPLNIAKLDESVPIMYMSEIFELYKPSYQRALMDMRRGHVTSYIKFFLQCVIEQCNAYIVKINQIKRIYNEDIETIEKYQGSSIYKIMPILMKNVVITKKELIELTGLSFYTVSKVLQFLIQEGIVEEDTSIIKMGYKYKRIYDVFVTR